MKTNVSENAVLSGIFTLEEEGQKNLYQKIEWGDKKGGFPRPILENPVHLIAPPTESTLFVT